MKIKLKSEQYNYLQTHLKIEQPDLYKVFENNNSLIFEIDEELASEIRDWIGEKLQKQGFNADYKLNEEGVILDELEDLFFS